MKPCRVLYLLMPLLFAAGPISAQSIEDGKSSAEKHCSRCHVVGDFNPDGGIYSTPSFQLIVNALEDYQERFDTFFVRPPHPAAVKVEGIKKLDDLPYNAEPVLITLTDVKNIAAFAKSLEKN
ncbi:MAG: hypothetical protein GY789_30430 [Hyphomicrobiales bacterium]|nr:hypothetical protein [Hyphomicrobiales bacterium]